jgi:hypothetical protein
VAVHGVRPSLIRLHSSLHFLKGMKISLLLVVVLLNFNVYSQTCERFKVVQVSNIHFSGLLIPTSSPHRFIEENLHNYNTL